MRARTGRAGTMEAMRLSDELQQWLEQDGKQTVGGLIEVFEGKSFAVLFVILLGVPALPLPTGGATHVVEIIAALLALELIAGRRQVWLPRRWLDLELAGPKQQRFLAGLMRLIRRLEHISRPRGRYLFHGRLSRAVFGLLVALGSAAAFLAPPFTGLDTLPALGVVFIALGVILEDLLVVIVGVLLALVGVVLEIVLGAAAIHGIGSLL